jgi:hypothetical protein
MVGSSEGARHDNAQAARAGLPVLKPKGDPGMSTDPNGVRSIIIVMDTILDIGTDIAAALDDKKLSISEGLSFSKHIPGAIAAIKAAPDLPGELKDLDAAEREEIIAHFAGKFDLPNDQIEDRVEKLFAVAVNLSIEVVAIVDVVKAFRANS